MKNLLLITTFLLVEFISNAQTYFENFPDQYNDDLSSYVFNYDEQVEDGEYNLILEEFPWFYNNDGGTSIFLNYPKSVKIELVSFPFVPICLPDCFSTTNFSRQLENFDLNLYNTFPHQVSYSGVNAVGKASQYNTMNIFTKVKYDLNDQYTCVHGYPTDLMTADYITNIYNGYKIFLPHSILKYTLYIRDPNDIESVIDSISWVVDNTRGRMRNYPFSDSNLPNTGPAYYDVTIFPMIQYHETAFGGHSYENNSNSIWYESPETDLDNGSINFFPFSDIVNSPYLDPEYLLYPDPENLDDYVYNFKNTQLDQFIHPPPYCIVNPTIRNSSGKLYAGYPTSLPNGIEHDYSIVGDCQLELLNPTEKVIYNPSVCTVNTVLIFPQDYKFLSVHGKPADRAVVLDYKNNYWPERGWVFQDYRDVPVPYPMGVPFSEYYINSEKEIHIEPNVIVMNAKFTGPATGSKGKLRYYPDQTYGNFEISPDLKLIWLSDEVVVEDPDEIWVNEIEFMGERIIVENGAKLTITNTLTMQPNGKIIVKRGGQLIIDGATITGNDTWAGIDVWGTADQPQNLIHQGLVRLMDNGTIEQAEIGIRTIKTIIDETDGEILDLHYTGGMVIATNSNFVNNRIAVVFYDYAINSISGFNGCFFITNDDYKGETDPDYFVWLKSMRGIDFLNCSFRNNSKNVCFGSGIYSFNSGFVVGNPEGDNGEFVNLYRGIYATSGGTVYCPEIYDINFTNNYRGIYFSAMDNGVIAYNNFTTGPSIDGASYGIYLDGSTGYMIEENEFNQGTSDGIGIVINNSDPEPNRIYNNYFEEMYFGIIAQQHNRADDGTGLVLKCNEYDNNTYDQVVTWEGPKIDGKAGIAAAQGADLPQPDAPAGNLFSWSGTTDFSDFYNEANIITYYLSC